MSRRQPFTLEQIAYHRNGISGCGFHVVLFKDQEGGRGHATNMVAVVFPEDDSGDGCKTSVLDRDRLAGGEIEHNTWRGDYYDDWLREQIKTHEERPFT